MRVHIISDVYPPEPVTAAMTAYDIVEELVQRHHEVTVFAPFPNRPTGHLIAGYKRAWKRIEQRQGYRIIYSWHTLSTTSTLVSRTAENLSFALTSTIQLMQAPRPDVVYMNTWAIFAQWLNTAVLYRWNVPVICVVHDIYPETFAEMGKMAKGGLLTRWLTAIDKQVYQHSAIVTVLNPVQRAYLIESRKLLGEKVKVFHDWVDAERFLPDQPKNNAFRARHHFSPDLFLAMYVGSLTRLAGLELYIEAAEQLRHREDIKILLVGDGAMRHDVEQQIQQRRLKNIQLIYPLETQQVPEVQAAADVLMLSLEVGTAEHTTPSKMLFYMFSERPILGSVKHDSPTAHIIHEANCGKVVDQGNAPDLAQHLETMANNRSSLPQLGKNARRYAEEHHLKSNVLPRIGDLIEQVGGGSPSLPQS
jgi:glycosyltransferase involved in cell wall biosynthesis